MDTEIVSGGLEGGFFHGTYSYKDEWGNSSPCELNFFIEQLGDIKQTDQNISIKFYGDAEHAGFLEFCYAVVKKFPQRKLSLMEKLRLKIKQWLLT